MSISLLGGRLTFGVDGSMARGDGAFREPMPGMLNIPRGQQREAMRGGLDIKPDQLFSSIHRGDQRGFLRRALHTCHQDVYRGVDAQGNGPLSSLP
jgi:hypothetical protein